MNQHRSPISLNLAEVAVALAVGAGTGYGLMMLYVTDVSALCGPAIDFSIQACNDNYRWLEEYALFTALSCGPLGIIFAFSALFLVRSLRNNIQHFTPLGHLALAWPLISFPFLHFLHWGAAWSIVPVGLLIAVIAVVKTRDNKHTGNFLAILWNAAWSCFSIMIYAPMASLF